MCKKYERSSVMECLSLYRILVKIMKVKRQNVGKLIEYKEI
jgi:hypothetical protein